MSACGSVQQRVAPLPMTWMRFPPWRAATIPRLDLGLALSETELAARSGDFATGIDLPSPHVWGAAEDLALSPAKLVTLDVPTYWEQDDAARVFAA